VTCPNPKCEYVGISDSTLHAIVGDGHHGVADDIPYWRGPRCQRRFSSRLGTPLSRLKTPPKRVANVMTALAEEADVSAAHRIFGHDERTLSDRGNIYRRAVITFFKHILRYGAASFLQFAHTSIHTGKGGLGFLFEHPETIGEPLPVYTPEHILKSIVTGM
jgi:hypothetical protein